LLSEDDVLMARTWTQVKAERHARAGADAGRVAQLKREMLEETQTCRDETGAGAPDESDVSTAKWIDDALDGRES
jgi:hypothetical protein